MLYVVYDRDFRSGSEREEEWHVGEPVPDIAPHRVVEIQVDGDEKTHVDKIMGGGIDKEPARYYGDFARTVWLNL